MARVTVGATAENTWAMTLRIGREGQNMPEVGPKPFDRSKRKNSRTRLGLIYAVSVNIPKALCWKSAPQMTKPKVNSALSVLTRRMSDPDMKAAVITASCKLLR